jgi:hypothetical protein
MSDDAKNLHEERLLYSYSNDPFDDPLPVRWTNGKRIITVAVDQPSVYAASPGIEAYGTNFGKITDDMLYQVKAAVDEIRNLPQLKGQVEIEFVDSPYADISFVKANFPDKKTGGETHGWIDNQGQVHKEIWIEPDNHIWTHTDKYNNRDDPYNPRNPYSMAAKTVKHEIGHALGLNHLLEQNSDLSLMTNWGGNVGTNAHYAYRPMDAAAIAARLHVQQGPPVEAAAAQTAAEMHSVSSAPAQEKPAVAAEAARPGAVETQMASRSAGGAAEVDAALNKGSAYNPFDGQLNIPIQAGSDDGREVAVGNIRAIQDSMVELRGPGNKRVQLDDVSGGFQSATRYLAADTTIIVEVRSLDQIQSVSRYQQGGRVRTIVELAGGKRLDTQAADVQIVLTDGKGNTTLPLSFADETVALLRAGQQEKLATASVKQPTALDAVDGDMRAAAQAGSQPHVAVFNDQRPIAVTAGEAAGYSVSNIGEGTVVVKMTRDQYQTSNVLQGITERGTKYYTLTFTDTDGEVKAISLQQDARLAVIGQNGQPEKVVSVADAQKDARLAAALQQGTRTTMAHGAAEGHPLAAPASIPRNPAASEQRLG